MSFYVLGTAAVILFFCGSAIAQYDPEQWEQKTLKLSRDATLEDIFKSGIRPYRFPGLETTTLEAKHLQLNLLLSSGTQLPSMQVEWVHITPYDDGNLATIEMATKPLSIDEARTQIERWYSYGSRSKEATEAYLSAVIADPVYFDFTNRRLIDGLPSVWRDTQEHGPTCAVSFNKTSDRNSPLRIYLKLTWRNFRKAKDRTRYRVPIPAPPGYENFSMEAPKIYGPDSTIDILRSKGIAVSGTYPPSTSNSELVGENIIDSRSENGLVAEVAKDIPPTDERGRGFAVGLVAAALALFSGAWFVLRRKSE
ncbi:hypothetical protein OAF27_01920 [Verrucomicrobiales bacterium]|nr:hypothetical protein [Verrucomicrobiales bacterium]